MKTPLSLQKPKISESDGLNPNEEHDSYPSEPLGDILTWNTLPNLSRGPRKIKSKKSSQNLTTLSSDFNSFTPSTVDSSIPTDQDKKDILDPLNSSFEKKDETNFGGSSPNESEISTMISQEGFDSKEKISKVPKLNYTRRDDTTKESYNPINEDLAEEMKAGTEVLAQNPSKSVISEEEDDVVSDQETPQPEIKLKQKTRKTPSPNKKAVQSQYKNLYKGILLEICNILTCLLNLIQSDPKMPQVLNTDWDEGILNHQILSTALEKKARLSEEEFDRWLKSNKKGLKTVLEAKRLSLFTLFDKQIEETRKYLKKAPKAYFKEYKKITSLDYLTSRKDEGELMYWILVVKLSLIWLPTGSPGEIISLLPVKKDTLPMFYWIITTRTELETKHLLLSYDRREHLRNELQKTFDEMTKSARQMHPHTSRLLDKISAMNISEPHLQPVTGKEEEPVSELMKRYMAYEAFTDSFYQGYREMQNKNIDSFGLFPKPQMDIEEISSQATDGEMTIFEEEEAIHREKYAVNANELRGFISCINFEWVSDEEDPGPNKKVKKDKRCYKG